MTATVRPLLFISAGEASGDHYGAELIEAVRRRVPGSRFTGLGGVSMECAGQVRVVRSEDVAVMGITEILRHVPRIYASYRRLVRSIRRERPDVAVLIDFPDVNFRLAKHLRRAGVPVVWFVSPQLWAWKRRRLRWVQQRVDRMLVIFPFEERFYAARGVEARFVGHPLAVQARERGETTQEGRAMLARECGLDAGAWWLALLPGSRWREIEANLPEMVRAAGLLEREFGASLQCVLPVAPGLERERLAALLATLGGPEITLVPDAAAVLPHARAAAVASGTATVLAALAGGPFVVVYRVSRLTYALARALVRYPKEVAAERDAGGNLPVGMVNLLAGRRVVPELLNESFTGEALAGALQPLLRDGAARREQMEALRAVGESLAQGTAGPVEAVADTVLELLDRAGTDGERDESDAGTP